MRRLLRPADWSLLMTYALLSLVPFAPLLEGRELPQAGPLLAVECAAWLALWALCGRPARFHWLLLPAFLALPAELYLRHFYNTGISAHHLGILLETTPAEALEFLGRRLGLLAACVLSAALWWGLTWRAAMRSCALDWRGSSRRHVLLLLALAGALWLYCRASGVTPLAPAAATSAGARGGTRLAPPTPAKAAYPDGGAAPETPSALPRLPAWFAIRVDAEVFGATWPFGLGVRLFDFWQERRYMHSLREQSAGFSFGARQPASLPQVVVLVIGESGRYDRWSLNGYERDTTPLLRQQKNLVSLGDVVTPVSATRLSVPLILSRKPALQSLRPGFAEKSLIGAYREAGFKTWWLSNQMSFGKFDTPVSVYAGEAEVARFLNLGGWRDGTSYDEVLLPALQRALGDPAPRKLIVLHTLGNHWNYSRRHPPQFERWRPSLSELSEPTPHDPALRAALNNSYDNATLYTDWLLAQVIGALQASGQLAAMMYVSDHGQALYDGSCELALHGHNTQYDFHVPALVWYADAWRAAYPDKQRQLLRHRDAPLSTENVFHSLLDLADIHYPGERLERSLFSERWQAHKRYVDSYGWADYDHASFRGDCREVIDRGTPLVRQR